MSWTDSTVVGHDFIQSKSTKGDSEIGSPFTCREISQIDATLVTTAIKLVSYTLSTG
jgi:hypothetical protein